MKPKFQFFAASAAILISFGFYISGSNDNIPSFDVSFNSGSKIILPANSMSGGWSQGSFIPVGTSFGSGIGYVNGIFQTIFVVGGYAPNASGILQRYYVGTDSWYSGTPLPYNIVFHGSAILKDSLYVFGGYLNGTNPTSSFYKYDINANSWSARASLPGLSAFCKGVGYQDSLIYVCRGYDGSNVYSTVYLYNSKNNTWRTASPIPLPRFGGAFSRSGDTLVYVSGADLNLFYNHTFRGVISSADRSVISWSIGATNPAIGAGMYRMDAAPWGCKGIIHTGGSNSSSFSSVSNIVSVYSPGSNTWQQQTQKPIPWTGGQSGTVSGADSVWKLVCASGYNGSTIMLNTEIFTDTLCNYSLPSVLTYCRNTGFTRPIITGSVIRDTITLNLPSHFRIIDVEVKIDTILHTYDADIDAHLIKGANTIELTTDNGGSGSNYIGTVFDDSSDVSITSGTAPFTGRFRPEQPLSPLINTSPNGNWILQIADDLGGDSGYLKSWCITFKYDEPNGIEKKSGQIPASFLLEQNYPNPFNPSTFISFGLPVASETKLIVYDMLGREVKILVNEFKPAGTYNVKFDAGDLSSGIYFYTLEAGDKFSMTKKMLLVK